MATSSKSTGAKPAKAAPVKKKAAAPKAPAKKAVAPKAVAAPKSAAKAAAPRKAAPKKAAVTPEQRRLYVEVAAYHIAERRGFQGGDPLADWAEAEAEIERLLAAGILKP